ncbi:fused MFS/spermidine synthase [Cupriavidus pinatubonensis]|uniref:Polyamine aminopropyltransferase n=1 Tax=Cupriavidus pinatubonensis TaxID=248026 RepID=A0ABM8XLX0_9BURK|nr:fused MFS/spermidine synthase [Cupriavidus pinatubonensis]CAG9181215.1 Polyamine aminopropyltransferase [Cupriavidus pinatubonensis]
MREAHAGTDAGKQQARHRSGKSRRTQGAAVRAGQGQLAQHGALLAPALLLFASGAAGLIYQVLWIKQLALVVGVDVHAVTTAVSAFFAGLALGGWLFGRVADRHARPLRLYAWLEIGVLVLAIGATLLLARSAAPFAWLESRVGLLAWALPFVLVILPAAAMGGTLPVLMRVLASRAGQVGTHGGRLYAANTTGAIAGTLLAGFVLIPWLGITGSALAAATLNGVAAIAAFAMASRAVATKASAADPVPASAQPARDAGGGRLALVLYAAAGGIALGYEVVWSQAIVQFISTRTFAFTVVLATYLAGLAIGSALAARRADRVRDPWGAFAMLIAAAGLVALLEIVVLGEWLLLAQAAVSAWVQSATSSGLAAACASFAMAALCVVFVPTLLLGAAFPFVLRVGVDNHRLGSGVGAVVALNTLGGIAGTAVAGFVLVPRIGLVHTLSLLTVGAGVVGVIAVALGSGVHKLARWAVPMVALLAVIAAALAPADRLATLLARARGGEIAFYEEGRGATVAVVKQASATHTFNRLYIQGVSNSGDTMTSLRYMRLQALLPLIVHGGTPRSVLVIGLGTGITAGATLPYPGLEHRVVAELLPPVLRAVPQFQGNYNVAGDKRVDIRLRDGRRELLQSDQRYDLITLEPPPPSAAGVVNLYSTDFYKLAAARLQPGGLVAQWLPLPTQNDEDTRALVRSFLDAFPYATLWTTELHEMMLVGSMSPIKLDPERIGQRFAEPEVSAALRAVGVTSPAALLATWVTGREGLERYAGDAPAVTDDHPRIEYAGWVRRTEFPQVLQRLLMLQTEPPLVEADAALISDIGLERETLHTFYTAGLDAYYGDREAWALHMNKVMRTDPDNPYYAWFGGGRRAAAPSRNPQ